MPEQEELSLPAELRVSDFAPDIAFTVVNPATQQASVYPGEAATLNVTLTNLTGGKVGLHSGADASTFTIFPPDFIAGEVIAKMSIRLDGWQCTPNEEFLVLTYTGANTEWGEERAIVFSITGVLTTSGPQIGMLQINPANMKGNVPAQIAASLSVVQKPKPGNAKLSDVLRVSLDQNNVYIARPGKPLVNSLFLTIKNIGRTALFTGEKPWTSRPKVRISFIYGRTAGALAPDDDRKDPETGSPWNIKGTPKELQGNDWSVTNPSRTGQDAHPVWILEPGATKPGILGVSGGESEGKGGASITIALDNIGTRATGHTEMIVQFEGFPKDDGTMYDNELYVLDIEKLEQPANVGLVKFFSPTLGYEVSQPGDSVSIPLNWVLYSAYHVKVFWAGDPRKPLLETSYPVRTLNADRQTVKLTYAQIMAYKTAQDADVGFTIQAFQDAKGEAVDSKFFPVYVKGDWRALTFSTTTPTVTVDDPSHVLNVPLAWSMFEVAAVKITCSQSTVSAFTKEYNPQQLAASDSTVIPVRAGVLAASLAAQLPDRLNFSLEAANPQRQRLGRILECSVSVTQRFLVDPRDGKQYPVLEVNNPRTRHRMLWTTRNMDWAVPAPKADASRYYKDNPAYAAQYGRLYHPWVAGESISPWRCASVNDWQELFEVFGSGDPSRAYTALIEGGSSGMNIQLGGAVGASFTGMGQMGIYWAGGWAATAVFQQGQAFIKTSPTYAMASMRYARDL